MPIIIAALVIGVFYLAHKSNPANAPTPTGTPNGVTIQIAAPPSLQTLKPANSVGLYGTTPAPSPFTGLGAPGASIEARQILFMQNGPGGVRLNAFMHNKPVGGTGLLDPLPDKGTRSKQLLTKDVVRGPGKKL